MTVGFIMFFFCRNKIQIQIQNRILILTQILKKKCTQMLKILMMSWDQRLRKQKLTKKTKHRSMDHIWLPVLVSFILSFLHYQFLTQIVNNVVVYTN